MEGKERESYQSQFDLSDEEKRRMLSDNPRPSRRESQEKSEETKHGRLLPVLVFLAIFGWILSAIRPKKS